MSLCEARLTDQQQKEKTRYKAMFDKLAEEDDTEGNSQGDSAASAAAAASSGGGDAAPSTSTNASWRQK